MIHYEFPLNEKVRTWLRLEDLFGRIFHFIAQEEGIDHHDALTTLFEILEASSRADLKSELLQELERQKRTITIRCDNQIAVKIGGESTLIALEQASADLLALLGKVGQHLRKNEWLMVIKQRASMPGGTCEFDLPSYHYWLQQDVEVRRADLDAWLAPLLPIHVAISMALRLLRAEGKPMKFVAHNGNFQQMQGGKGTQMLRLAISREYACVPEVGANKYALNIRFLVADYATKPSLFQQDIPFELTFCSLS
ncbi:MAG: cell division protein ZapD [Gallionella sp.]